ncbi:hypothetical protein BH23CHL7_BH23CHL7_10680 [soil metagenome]
MIDHAQRYDHERLLIPAIWLIGVGGVLLIQQLSQWSWAQAWPLWVILVGVAGVISTLVRRSRSPAGWWSIGTPLAIALAGFVLLASTTGMIATTVSQLVPLWPLAVIGLGTWFVVGALLTRPHEGQLETLSVPLDGAQRANVRLRFGGGELTVGRAEPGMLVSGRFQGGVVRRSRGPGAIDLEPYSGSFPFWWSGPLQWHVGITGEVPVDLKLETGANRSSINLEELRISHLELHTGASETRVRLPAEGTTSVKAHAGLASMTLEVPPGVAARIRSRVAIGSSSIDERRFPRVTDGWASPDFEAAANRVEVDMEGGLGELKVI